VSHPLVIVESPAKAKTIAGFLGPGYVVESSIGHIRDLPRSAAEVPAALKAEPWARLGVDVDHGFKPLYVVAKEKRDQVRKLTALLKDASELYLATDEDREGESIAWHLQEVLAPRVPVKRMVFHEITAAAIREAIDRPRELDRRLVDAQEARRVLDRLYGYEVSPVLWRKVSQGLSAGRVQSVATRIIVERERERIAFRSAAWWGVEGRFRAAGGELVATLLLLAGRRVATGDDFDSAGELKAREDVICLDEALAAAVTDALETSRFTVTSVEQRPYRRSPFPPFITSTLQQEAARKLRFSAQRTMQVAQRLYEQGYITYMRTDSTTLSETAIHAAREQAAALFGKDHVPARPRTYDRKVKNAQEAHEAIRPAGDHFRAPTTLAGALRGDELALYELIWQRTLASQMVDATGSTARIRIEGLTTRGHPGLGEHTSAVFGASGTVISFPGFLRVYTEASGEEEESPRERRETTLPAVSVGEALDLLGLGFEEHATKPPARYTEASLVRKMEELGVGRPSTYASILGTIQDRGYVWKKGTALVPSFVAFAVVQLLEAHFAKLVDYGFTASMEDDLDAIAAGEAEAVPWLARFYFGSDGPGAHPPRPQPNGGEPSGSASPGLALPGAPGEEGLKEAVSAHLGQIDAREVNSISLGVDRDGREILVRVGRYGPYLQRGEERAPLSETTAPDELTIAVAEELLSAPSGDRSLGVDPASGLEVVARVGRYGPYVQLGEAGDKGSKPRTSSLFKSMSIETVTLDQALSLLSLPRVVGKDPDSGAEIEAANGRYGPYLRRNTETRSLESEDELFTVTLERAVELFSQPKQRRFGRAAPAGRELGSDPESGLVVTLREGRFGPYVTDGTTNASLRRGDDPETITIERAAELLHDRRAAGPPKARSSTRRATPKAAQGTKTPRGSARTTATAKPAAKKPAAKKPAAKKPAAKSAASKGPETSRAGGRAKDFGATARKTSTRSAASSENVAPDVPAGTGRPAVSNGRAG